MTWNYRIIDHGDHLALHEVYYDEAGNPGSFTSTPATFVVDPEEGKRGLVASLVRAMHDASARPVLARGVFFGGEAEADGLLPLTWFDVNRHLHTADDVRELLRAALEEDDDSHVLSIVRDIVSGSPESSIAVALDTAREIAAGDDGLEAVPAHPAPVAMSLDEAYALCVEQGRPVRFFWGGRPVTIYPKGTKPEGRA